MDAAEYGRCRVWTLQGMDAAEYGHCRVWTLQSMDTAEYGHCRVRTLQSMDTAEYGHCRVWTLHHIDTRSRATTSQIPIQLVLISHVGIKLKFKVFNCKFFCYMFFMIV